MPIKQRIELLSLSGQLLTAAPGTLLLNGVAVGGGGSDGIALSGALTQTGVQLSVAIATRIETVPFSVGPVTWTAMPGTGAFFAGSTAYATYLDLSRFTGVNLVVNRTNTVGAVTGFLWLGYRVAPFQTTPSGYARLDTLSTNVMLGTVNTVVTSGFAPLAAAARSGVYVALFGSGGAALSPTFGTITALFL